MPAGPVSLASIYRFTKTKLKYEKCGGDSVKPLQEMTCGAFKHKSVFRPLIRCSWDGGEITPHQELVHFFLCFLFHTGFLGPYFV
ncbi:hypothetical protein CEXT_765141 [Caerostris extrusa]|uniref:Uncharacterized protein n=1 Tax=Caerostris extrusa TaxID=172846 RepID=A0AAV4M289_CAEEX|nr:hypothetical protein CEXT_765141 [Caerostris extrusa]